MSRVAGVGLARRFGGVHAVADVDVAVDAGEIVAVVGPNGSGKSTLIDVLTGVTRADAGTISVDSRILRKVSAGSVARRGVRRTFQGGRLVELLSVYDNVRLGLHASKSTTPWGTGRHGRRSLDVIDAMDIGHLASRRVCELSVGERRRVELARALVGDPTAVVLDEPTSGLPRPDGRRLTQLLRGVAAAGVGVLMIEHDLEVVKSCADRVVVMVDGRISAAGGTTTLDEAGVRLTMGTPARGAVRGGLPASDQQPSVSARALTVRRAGRSVLRDIDLDLFEGQLIALFGGNGSGKSTLLGALSGVLTPERGTVVINGTDVTGWPAHRVSRHGVVLLPQGRHLFPSMTTEENLSISDASLAGRSPLPTDTILDRFAELRSRLHVPVGQLSGGEQQMVMLARGLRSRPSVVLADEPTAALSPSARQRVLSWLRELADAGATVLVAEQNMVETAAVADRTMTMRDGRIDASAVSWPG